MSLALASPWMLLGGLLIALPVIAHLTGYRQLRQQPFPSLRFLRASRLRSRRRSRIEQWLLLLLRLLLVVVLVMLFARPSLERLVPGLAGFDPSRPALILIDVSASASANIGARPVFEVLQDEALKLLAGVGEGTPAGVIAFDDRTQVLGPGMTADLSVLRRAVTELRVGAGATDLEQALRRALAVLQAQGLGSATIFVLSDGTASQLPGLPLRDWPAAIGVHYYDFGRSDLENRFVRSAAVELTGAGGRGVRVVAEVDSAAPSSAKVPISLRMGSDLTVHQDLVLEDGAGRSVFSLPLLPSGDQLVELVLNGDDLAVDDRHPFVLRGDVRLSVLLISGEGGGHPRDDEVWFVEKALQPGGGAPSQIQPRVVRAEAIHQLDSAAADVVFLCNVTDPGPIAADLEALVRAGGGLFISVGRRVNPDHYNEVFSDLLPSLFTEVKSRGEGSFEISPVGLALPPLDRDEFRVFRSGGSAVFAQARFGRMIATEPRLQPDSRVLLRYSDGMPALLERKLGKGRVLLFTSSVDDDWTDLPLRSIFVPLMHQVARSLSGTLRDEGSAAVEVGQELALSMPAERSRKAWLVGPDGREHALDSMLADAAGVLRWGQTRLPGLYQLFWEGSDGEDEQLVALHAVRIPARESKLTKLSPRAMFEAVPGLVYHGRDGSGGAEGHSGEVLRRSSLTPVLLAVVVLLLLLESLLGLRRS
ncbi:MAG: hypothetical protein CMP23_07225 [Rickettsiales bacterium]|nr:hypothetical protein [Rickettsiales bacterium]